jgi:serine O-acetyltransferase
VIVGAGAQVLGPITVGHGARIGANAVVLKDVPPGATMVGIPARPVMAREASLRELAHRATYDGAPVNAELLAEEFRTSHSEIAPQREGFVAYGTPSADLPDPVARAIDALAEQVNTLKARVEELERQGEANTGDSDAGEAGERSKALHG